VPDWRQRGGGGLDASAGLHRYTWNLRGNGVRGTGPLVLPGEYELRLVHAGGEARQLLTVELDPRVKAAGITNADLQAQADLILRVQRARQRADAVVSKARQIIKEPTDEVTHSRVDRVLERLVDERVTYPQPMVVSQLRYLSSMIDRADQRPGRDAFERLAELEAAIEACEKELEQIAGER